MPRAHGPGIGPAALVLIVTSSCPLAGAACRILAGAREYTGGQVEGGTHPSVGNPCSPSSSAFSHCAALTIVRPGRAPTVPCQLFGNYEWPIREAR